MNKMNTRTASILTSLAALMTAGLTVHAQYTYRALDDPFASGGTWAEGISGTSVVGGYLDNNGVNHGFLYSGGTNWTTLDDPLAGSGSGQGTYANAISGINIVGSYVNASLSLIHI